MQQRLGLQSQSLVLRQALLDRGLEGGPLQFVPLDGGAGATAPPAQPVDWECAIATESSPKSCLFSFQAQTGTKVLAPRTNDSSLSSSSSSSSDSSSSSSSSSLEWITLSTLNRLRRDDPSKVEPLWHNRYAILSTWFDNGGSATTLSSSTTTWLSPYSLYAHLSPLARFVSALLDSPLFAVRGSTSTTSLSTVLVTVLGVTVVGLASVVVTLAWTLPLWELVLRHVATSTLVWQQWPLWGRWLHAAFPLKFLVLQYVWKYVAFLLYQLWSQVRSQLVTLEGELWERCIPRTLLLEKEEEEEPPLSSTTTVPFLEEDEDEVVVRKRQVLEDDDDDDEEEDHEKDDQNNHNNEDEDEDDVDDFMDLR
ncbi:hypothetical protein ACA910_001322 [Epithemia clementina (nom. ined.)]